MLDLEFVKKLAAEEMCEAHEEGVSCGVCTAILIARELLDKRWKNIKKEPNPESVRILAARPDNNLGSPVRIAFQTSSYEWCDEWGQVMKPRWEPTHWMPLPERPSEDE